MKKKIIIIGVGLIGGSIGLRLKKKNTNYKIIGFGRNEYKLKRAVELGAIDEYYTNIDEIKFEDIEIVFLCTPIEQIIETAKVLIEKLDERSVITDVGSVKSHIIEEINKSIKEKKSKVEFIGAHPIAGKEKSGIENASDILFENSYCIITPVECNSKEKIRLIKNIWELLGSKVILMTAERHDIVTAAISHLPHIISAALVNTAGEIEKKENEILNFAAGGFKDITRISSSDENLWTQICLANKDEILNILKIYKSAINNFENFLLQNNEKGIKNYFKSAKEIRNSIRKQGAGFLLNYYDLLVDVEDKPGVIASITNLLSDNSINIKDIEILKYREEESGVLKLSFENEIELDESVKILNNNGYSARKR